MSMAYFTSWESGPDGFRLDADLSQASAFAIDLEKGLMEGPPSELPFSLKTYEFDGTVTLTIRASGAEIRLRLLADHLKFLARLIP